MRLSLTHLFSLSSPTAAAVTPLIVVKLSVLWRAVREKTNSVRDKTFWVVGKDPVDTPAFKFVHLLAFIDRESQQLQALLLRLSDQGLINTGFVQVY